MSLPLDHVVIAVLDLETAIADYTALGFQVLRGGDHPGRPTHNALVVFADGSYLELIAWKSPAPQERWWPLLQRHGEGIVDFALLPQDTAETVAGAARRGLVLEGPLDGGRLRPDGERLLWQTARPASADLPFLCGDITPRALRVPEGDARVHPNDAIGVASLEIAVQDLDTSLARYRALFGDDASDAQISAVSIETGSGRRCARITLGTCTLRLSSPDAMARHPSRSEGPAALVLRRSAAAPSGAALDIAMTHGAPIRFEASRAT
jgi:catechol 2,3-dioxygenase-like lactoylglutathione lyase family enzyme